MSENAHVETREEAREKLPVLSESTAPFPAGDYAVIDPCMVFSEPAWQHVVYNLSRDKDAVAVTYEGCRFFVWTSKTGDGIFPLYRNENFYANIEASHGLLCIAPAALLDLAVEPPGSEEELADALGIYKVGAETPHLTADGNVKHGDFELITSGVLEDGYQTQPWPYGD